MIELDEIMRQRGDSQFAELLCRVRTATCKEDIKILESRTITDDHPDYPHDALHAYPWNQHIIDEKNRLKLLELAPEDEHIVIRLIDKDKDKQDKDKHSQLLDLQMPDSKS